MRLLAGIILLALACVVGWWIGGRLSTDALAMTLGVLFGFMAAIPATIIALSMNRQQRESPRKPVETTALTIPPARYHVVEKPE